MVDVRNEMEERRRTKALAVAKSNTRIKTAKLSDVDEREIRKMFATPKAAPHFESWKLMAAASAAAILAAIGLVGYAFFSASDAPVVAEQAVSEPAPLPQEQPVEVEAVGLLDVAQVPPAITQTNPHPELLPDAPLILSEIMSVSSIAPTTVITASSTAPDTDLPFLKGRVPLPLAATTAADLEASSVIQSELLPAEPAPFWSVAGLATQETDHATTRLASLSAIEPLTSPAAITSPLEDGAATASTEPPEPLQTVGPVLAAQVAYSHWDVAMPFEASIETVRKAVTATITEVNPTADLAISGTWIAEGATIYAINGETLNADTPFSGHVLNALSIDPDGYTRASVRYREANDGAIDRGLLAVPVVRTIGLADGTVLEARVVGREWQVTVADVPAGGKGTLLPGDILTSEASTGTDILGHEDIAKVLDRLAERQVGTAEFAVIRNGRETKAELQLAREG